MLERIELARRQLEKPLRDLIIETFTPQRVGLLSWAFAAVFMGTVGLASYQFSSAPSSNEFDSATAQQVQVAVGPAQIMLPPPGDVDSTASIGIPHGNGPALRVMDAPELTSYTPSFENSAGQIEVLQREIIGLRRRLSALSEQNAAYSRRIAALERKSSFANLSEKAAIVTTTGTEAHNNSNDTSRVAKAPQRKPVDVDNNPTTTAPSEDQITEAAPNSIVRNSAPQSRSEIIDRAEGKTTPRRIQIYQKQPETNQQTIEIVNLNEPVRIVPGSGVSAPNVVLPEAANPPSSTAAIPSPDSQREFDATPTSTTDQLHIISPSTPAGTLRGGGKNQLKRSDFGAIIGTYSTSAGAAKAWADFKSQNVERMRDLKPLLMQQEGANGEIALLVGPFANAADAAIACFHLLDVTTKCQPTLYAGDPLVVAAEIRQSPL